MCGHVHVSVQMHSHQQKPRHHGIKDRSTIISYDVHFSWDQTEYDFKGGPASIGVPQSVMGVRNYWNNGVESLFYFVMA